VFGGFDKCRFWRDLCDYSILPGVLDTQEVVGSSPIPPISPKLAPFDVAQDKLELALFFQITPLLNGLESAILHRFNSFRI